MTEPMKSVNRVPRPEGCTEVKVLTRFNRGRGHRELGIVIDWDGITQEQLKFMAQQLIVHNLRAELFHADGEFPEEVFVQARMAAAEQQPCNRKYDIPESWKSGTDKPAKVQKAAKTPPNLLDLLSGLSKEELAALLK